MFLLITNPNHTLFPSVETPSICSSHCSVPRTLRRRMQSHSTYLLYIFDFCVLIALSKVHQCLSSVSSTHNHVLLLLLNIQPKRQVFPSILTTQLALTFFQLLLLLLIELLSCYCLQLKKLIKIKSLIVYSKGYFLDVVLGCSIICSNNFIVFNI